MHYRAALLISGCIQGTSKNKLFKSLNWNELSTRTDEKYLKLMYQVKNKTVPSYLQRIFDQHRNPVQNVNLRRIRHFTAPKPIGSFSKSPVTRAIRLWEKLPTDQKESKSFASFKRSVKTHLKDKNLPLPTSQLELSRKSEIFLNR